MLMRLIACIYNNKIIQFSCILQLSYIFWIIIIKTIAVSDKMMGESKTGLSASLHI